MEKKITGVIIYYYKVCKRKMWYFYNDIAMEHESDNVTIGKLLDTEAYKRDKKHINIDNVINIDFIKSNKVLHEIKKSRKIEDASILQVKYYLYYLKERGIDITAKIDYPLLKQTMTVELLEEDEENIRNILLDIDEILSKNIPPTLDKKSICKSCAYYDLCYI